MRRQLDMKNGNHGMTTIVTFILMLTMAITVNATDYAVTSTLYSVYPLSDGSIALSFNTEVPTCASASVPKRFYIIVGQNGVTAEGAKQMYAAALLALAADKNVYFAFSDLSVNCYVNRLMVFK